MKAYEVIISEDKVVYKTIGEFESSAEFEETLPEGFKKVSYNNIWSEDWEGHKSLMDEQVEGLPDPNNDHFKYVSEGRLLTLADETITAKWYGTCCSTEPALPVEVQ